jgi:predicted RNA-binding protein with PUA-like domain
MAPRKRYWLMKSEPDVYSIDDLEEDGEAEWEGVRNYQARNFMRDKMKVGDLVLFYHSNAKPSGVAGTARVCRTAYPDPTAFDKKSRYYDKQSKVDEPRWVMVDVEFVGKLERVIPLTELKANSRLERMKVVQRGMRLSIQPVTAAQYRAVLAME